MHQHTSRAGLVAAGAAAALISVGAPSAQAAPGELDAGFGIGGVVRVDLGAAGGFLNGVAVQPDGKLVEVGGTGTTKTDALVVRLRPDGSRDTGFGVDGVVRLDLGDVEIAQAVAVQPDGAIVVAGSTSTHHAVVWRLTPDGAPDAGFGTGGVATIDTGSRDALTDVVVQTDGRIVVAGKSGAADGTAATVARLSAQGQLDPTFGSGSGVVVLPRAQGEYHSLEAVDVQPDGRVVVTGGTPGRSGLTVLRLTVDGALDPAFGVGGAATVPGTTPYGYDLRVLPDGGVAVLGLTSLDGVDHPYLARLDASGTADPAFGGVVDRGAREFLYAMDLDPAGRVVAGGEFGPYGVVTRFDAAGHLDASFGDRGVAGLPGRSAYANGVAAQADGKVVAVGDDGGTVLEPVMVRFEGDPAATVSDRTPRCHGLPATIVGTSGQDHLRGTKWPDVIVALAGADRVSGRGGDDVVCAGDGNDTVRGGGGRDRLLGEAGRDRLLGGGGKDRLKGGPGRDTVRP